jgi:hypothetical protein
MSINSKLTQYVESLSPKDRIKEIRKLSQLFPDVAEYYQAKLSNEGETELMNKYTSIIEKEFRSDNVPGRARISVAKKAVSDFIKISTRSFNKAEIMMRYVESGVRFTNAYGDIDEPFYNSMETMFEKALKYISENKTREVFRERCAKIVSDTDGIGWGFYDGLSELFSRYMQQ